MELHLHSCLSNNTVIDVVFNSFDLSIYLQRSLVVELDAMLLV